MNAINHQPDVLILGAGIIGLSMAYELAVRGADVILCDTHRLGSQASWAAAGILPATGQGAIHPLEHLEELSTALHHQWHDTLLGETGIDNQFQVCGSLHIARSVGDAASLAGVCEHWAQHSVQFEQVDRSNIGSFLNGAATATVDSIKRACWVPGEAQVHNPTHLNALTLGCKKRGVVILESVNSVELVRTVQDRIAADLDGQRCDANSICVAAGPWSEQLLASLSIPLPSLPVRGQIVLFKMPKRELKSIIYEGSRYLVPRRDGHVLAGATIEETGFDNSTTAEGIAGLKAFANAWHTRLNEETVVKAWAGLRPATYDGFPYLGRAERSSNLFIATGHFKSGIHLSTGTAKVMADLILDETSSIDLTPFAPSRVADMSSPPRNRQSMETNTT